MKCRTFSRNTASLRALVVLLWALSGSHMHAADRDNDKGNDAIRVGIITGRDGPPSRADASQAGESSPEMKKTVAGHKLRYLLQTPAGEKPKAGWPLLLFLHGYGECGENIEKVKKHGPPKLIAKFDSLAGCVIVSPQCPRDSWWRVDALKALVEEVIECRGDIDRRRLYVTGLSMGGYGIWSFISHYPDYFAAAIPICGGGDPFRLPANRPPVKTGIENDFDPASEVVDQPNVDLVEMAVDAFLGGTLILEAIGKVGDFGDHSRTIMRSGDEEFAINGQFAVAPAEGEHLGHDLNFGKNQEFFGGQNRLQSWRSQLSSYLYRPGWLRAWAGP